MTPLSTSQRHSTASRKSRLQGLYKKGVFKVCKLIEKNLAQSLCYVMV